MRYAVLLPIFLLLFVPINAAEQGQYSLTARTVHEYYSHTLGGYTTITPFWLLYGENIQWWQGGIIFEYHLPNSIAREKINTLLTHLTQLFHDLGFVVVAGTVRPTYVKVVYQFDGVVEYGGYIFADGNGTITVEWAANKPLTITVNSMVTANASTVKYLTGATWEEVSTGYATQLRLPEAYVSLPKGRYDILLVPRDGYIRTDYFDTACGTKEPSHLGGGPRIYRGLVFDETVAGYQLRDSGSYYHRQPLFRIVNENTTYRIDRFWCTEVEL